MPAVHGFHRPSSTKGKHIHLSSPALAKGLACTTCKIRKVRCDGQKPSCNSCRRTARFEGRDEEEVVCYYEGRKCGTRKSRRSSAEQEEEQKLTIDQLPPLPPVLPLPQPAAERTFDTGMDHNSLAAKLLAFNHLSTVDSNLFNFSAISSERPSSSTSSSFDLPASSSTSSLSYEPLDATSFPTYFPSQVLSSSPLAMLDASDYFAALQPAPSTSTSSFSSLDSSSSVAYPSYDLSSLFLAAPAPQPAKAEPSYFDMPPPIEKQEWPEHTQTSSTAFDATAGLGTGGIPLTPGWSIDYSAFAGLTALF